MNIAIIGCGNMGSAIARGLASHVHLFLYDRHLEKAQKLSSEGCGCACQNVGEAMASADVVILAVKPKSVNELSIAIKEHLHAKQILISLLAGITLDTLHHLLPGVPIVRMMPNLAITCKKGIIAISHGPQHLPSADISLVAELFEELGKVYCIPEDSMDAMTSLAASGPAFVFAMIEAMVDSGIAMGLSSSMSMDIVQQMILGSVSLLTHTRKHPGELKWAVASPAGTTIYGLKVLEESALRGSIMNVFIAAYKRSKEL
jgi:pyrroline-5-carboxylate reductase